MARGKLFQTTGRIIRGAGCLDQLGEEIERLGCKRVLVVSDPGIVKAGIVDRVTATLRLASLEVTLFTDVEPDPRVETAAAAAAAAKSCRTQLLVGIGGGSAIDVAKVASVMATNEQQISALFGIDLVPKPGLPLIAIPTTAGTGSEVTPIAILSDEHEKLKKGIVSPHLFPRVALLDAELTVGLPPAVTAASGMDALIHAIEAFTSRNCEPLTDILASQAMKLLYVNLPLVFADGRNLKARAEMLEGSLLAGMAFANAGVTAVHAFAYPIGAEFHIPHGVANSIMLAPVMEFNQASVPGKFAAIADVLALTATEDPAGKAAATVAAMRNLVDHLNLPTRLSRFGIKDEHIDGLAAGVMKVTRLLANNPRELRLEDAKAIYRHVL